MVLGVLGIMLQSLRTRFVGGQETVNVDDEGKVDFSEAVDGDDFVLVDVLPSPDQVIQLDCKICFALIQV